jgi:hypothetical protein
MQYEYCEIFSASRMNVSEIIIVVKLDVLGLHVWVFVTFLCIAKYIMYTAEVTTVAGMFS